MLAAINPVFRGLTCRTARSTATDSCRNVISVQGSLDDRLTGRWHVVAGNATLNDQRDTGATVKDGSPGNCLTVVRTEQRSFRSRILDRIAGRDRYHLLWRDDARGQCVIARADRRRVWILTRARDMQTRDLFLRVADLRERGFQTRDLHYAHIA